MKHLLVTLLLAFSLGSVFAAEKTLAGPKGGRLLHAGPLQAEFFVNADRKAEIDFYDNALKPVAPATQVVTLIAEPSGNRTPLDLEKTATGFVSKQPLPESAAPYRVVVQIRATPDAKPANFRLDLNLSICAECNHAEYACTCVGH